MMKMMRRLALLFVALTGSVQGGTVYLSFNQHSTQNLFQTREAVSDRISAFSLAVEQGLGALSLLADAEYTAFHQTAGLSFFSANAGLDALVPAGGKSAFYFAAGAAGAFYSRDYAAFSTFGGSLTGAFKTYLSPSSILKIQGQGAYASYADMIFDHASVVASLSIDRYFPTRTTLKADAEYGYKHFLHPYAAAPGPLTDPGGSAVMSAGPRRGPGSGSGWGGRRYDGGYGFIPRAGVGTAGIGHVSASLLAAQGIGDVLGLSVSALRQWTVSGENPFLSIEEFYLAANPSSDSFSWAGDQLTGRVTLNLPWSIELKTGYTASDKTFPGIELLDLAGLPTGVPRNDVRRLFEARLEKNFRRLTVYLAYSHIKNASNDPLFEWSSGYIMGGFQWNLPVRRKGGI